MGRRDEDAGASKVSRLQKKASRSASYSGGEPVPEDVSEDAPGVVHLKIVYTPAPKEEKGYTLVTKTRAAPAEQKPEPGAPMTQGTALGQPGEQSLGLAKALKAALSAYRTTHTLTREELFSGLVLFNTFCDESL